MNQLQPTAVNMNLDFCLSTFNNPYHLLISLNFNSNYLEIVSSTCIMCVLFLYCVFECVYGFICHNIVLISFDYYVQL